MLVNVLRGFEAVSGDAEWCRDNYLNRRSLFRAGKIKSQLRSTAMSLGLTIETSSEYTQGNSSERLRKAMLKGLFLNTARRDASGQYVTFDGGQVWPCRCLCVLDLVFVFTLGLFLSFTTSGCIYTSFQLSLRQETCSNRFLRNCNEAHSDRLLRNF